VLSWLVQLNFKARAHAGLSGMGRSGTMIGLDEVRLEGSLLLGEQGLKIVG
jgi:hypothetical protein